MTRQPSTREPRTAAEIAVALLKEREAAEPAAPKRRPVYTDDDDTVYSEATSDE